LRAARIDASAHVTPIREDLVEEPHPNGARILARLCVEGGGQFCGQVVRDERCSIPRGGGGHHEKLGFAGALSEDRQGDALARDGQGDEPYLAWKG
jgi:hypothetical protein